MLKRLVRFRPADLLPLGFSAALLLLALLFHSRFNGTKELLQVTLALGISLLAAWLRARFQEIRAVKTALDFSPMVSLILIFDSLGPFIQAVNPVDHDVWLIAADRWLCGTDPTRWLEPFSVSWLSDLLTVCYALFFFYPLILAVIVYGNEKRHAPDTFSRYSVVILTSFFLSYCGFFAVPATGPRFNITHEGPVPRGFIGTSIDTTLNQLESNKRNCFPSGHTAVTVVVLVEAWFLSRRTFWVFLAPCLGLVAATVYGRYHYVTDVAAGLVLVPVALYLGNRLYEWLASRLEGTGRLTSR
jgi:membrane-associated phospholipid phosphatase